MQFPTFVSVLDPLGKITLSCDFGTKVRNYGYKLFQNGVLRYWESCSHCFKDKHAILEKVLKVYNIRLRFKFQCKH